MAVKGTYLAEKLRDVLGGDGAAVVGLERNELNSGEEAMSFRCPSLVLKEESRFWVIVG